MKEKRGRFYFFSFSLSSASFYINFARPNSHKGNKTPWDIVKEDRHGISPEVLLFPPVFLDDYFREKFLALNQVGRKIPVDPANF